jgi:hypothetical protein
VAEKVGSDEYQSNKVRLSFLSSIIIGATRFSYPPFRLATMPRRKLLAEISGNGTKSNEYPM